jgi:hypothetical protein
MGWFRAILSRSYWLLGLAGNVHWAIYTGSALVISAVITGYAFLRDLPLLLLAIIFIGTFLFAVGLINYIPDWWVALRSWVEDEWRRREQEALDEYFAKIEEWLHGPDAPLSQKPPNERIRVSAQERTIGILPGLSPDGKRRVVRFLHRHELIKVGTAIISLAHADLSSANLSGLRLQDSLLTGANLRDANLSDARLCNFQPTDADWERAFKRGVLQMNLSEPTEVGNLMGCDLSGAVLRETLLAGCNLRFVDFAGADLDRTDIRAADLRRAQNLTQKQIASAYGSHNQQGGMSDTLLPYGLKAPDLWKRPLSQQKGVRQAKS